MAECSVESDIKMELFSVYTGCNGMIRTHSLRIIVNKLLKSGTFNLRSLLTSSPEHVGWESLDVP